MCSRILPAQNFIQPYRLLVAVSTATPFFCNAKAIRIREVVIFILQEGCDVVFG